MNFDEALRYLLSLGHETLAIKLGLATTHRLLEALASPQEAFIKVQIAGTNGKGSTAVMLDSITRQAGIRTGLYTSPHLVNITERIRIDGAEISREDFARHANTVREAAENLRHTGALSALPTFFEQMTAIALVAFREAGVQFSILETGLGGRLDSTTAANAEIAAITPIAFDHQEYLGNTIEEIAAEKAAIIRHKITYAAVISAQLHDEAHKAILERCLECGVTPRDVDDCIVRVADADATGRLWVSFATAQDVYKDMRLALRGRHQAINASVAIRLAEALREKGLPISAQNIRAGIEEAFYAGRLEWREGSPAILFDGAHNAAGAHALREYLDEFVKAPVTLLFGAMRNKDLREVSSTLFPAAQRVILTHIENPRAANLEMLMDAVPSDFDRSKLAFAASAAEAWNEAKRSTPNHGIVCVSGSLYLIGEMQKILGAEAGR
ncbi:MAG: bifunctional folylpolyglutamate synthase/dihydrofolate synthase [Pyrinomonadaceae bacterium]